MRCAATRGYGEDAALSAADIALAHRDLARRYTWALGTELGSDHLPQMVTVWSPRLVTARGGSGRRAGPFTRPTGRVSPPV